jgi:hypothetical protein
MRVFSQTGPTLSAAAVDKLNQYDAATAAQAAYLLEQAGLRPLATSTHPALKSARPQVRQGFLDYATAWRQSQQAVFRDRQQPRGGY